MFVDTWRWLALGHEGDPSHEEVEAIFESLDDEGVPRHTTDYVLDELLTLLFRRERAQVARDFVEELLRSAQMGHVSVHRITTTRFEAAWELREKYIDKPGISFTDLASMAVMDEVGLDRVITDDGDFVKVNRGYARLP